MFPGSIRRLALASSVLLGLVACGGDDGPAAATPPPSVAGGYYVQWTLQVLRKSDGFQTQFQCYGQMTLVQGVASPSLSGFAGVDSGCTPESYDLSGTVKDGGVVEFTTNGPRPPEGPCPGGKGVRFTGQVTTTDSYALLNARGVTTVTCPQFGDHEFTYLIRASK